MCEGENERKVLINTIIVEWGITLLQCECVCVVKEVHNSGGVKEYFETNFHSFKELKFCLVLLSHFEWGDRERAP